MTLTGPLGLAMFWNEELGQALIIDVYRCTKLKRRPTKRDYNQRTGGCIRLGRDIPSVYGSRENGGCVDQRYAMNVC